jgi:Ser/Thr protein kinase RdoA (MazF antagonist)
MKLMKNRIELYQQRLHLQSATFSRVDHDDAMVAIVYRVFQPNGEQLILKIHDRVNDYLREVHFLKHLTGIVPVPQIIQTVQPDEDLNGVILMECLPGAILKIGELTESLAYEIGRCLALIHLNRLPGYGDPIQGSLIADPRVYFTLKFEEGLDECRSLLPLDLIEQCHRYFERHIDDLMAVDGPCIVHRDFRPGNLIVNHGKLQGIIDWAGARASFAEEDFCSLEHGEWPDNPNSKNSFLAGYGSVRLIPDYSRLISLLRLNKAIGIIGFTAKRGTWKDCHTHLHQFNRHFLETLFKS